MLEHRGVRGWSLMVVVIAAPLLIGGCDGDNDVPNATPRAVQAIIVQARPLTLTHEWPGRTEPDRVAEVRARVAGIVLSRNFEEGADVEAGQVLFQIDPAPFKATLSRAQGELAKADAELFDARAAVKRYTPLAEIEAVSRQDFDAAQAALKSALAARQSAQADVETARLELDDATVRASISGRIGRAQVTEGALVGENEATALATIQQLDPAYADFKQPVADVLRMRAALAEGRLAQDRDQGAWISVTVDGTDQTRDGHLLFSDITVDRTTGQVSLRGQLANPDALLLPGMYVRVHTQQGVDPNAILVPQRAVRRSTKGKAQVLLIGKDDIVEARPVTTGTMQGSEWHILGGLKSGERIIIGGTAGPTRSARLVVLTAAYPANLFSGGRNVANLDLAEARKDIAVAGYEHAIQTAFKEVSDALAATDTLRREEASRRSLAISSTASLRLSQARYDAGVDDYLRFLKAQRTDFSNQNTLIDIAA
ncbi:efflux RND transporter periplasmic adaptor subunit [Enterobacteriales bacterium SAP-6]|uniref:Efflux RND transporter periplasmic adaptor subunit n=2 Tax=Acerihabitans arboris TaxID=2691583 RepID=A0A845SE14_9GAMM|nr:efflux RND transporter periplasmic adaptor subunit [Acerihabitans arboris]